MNSHTIKGEATIDEKTAQSIRRWLTIHISITHG